ncbi:MAG: hypothetical protein JRG97_11080 [Deltaproteobacteria bacterium]|nr:hypothetical protein [Deltaproteobacteria bacterium]
MGVAWKGGLLAERKRCRYLRPRLKGGAGDTHNGFRSTAVPLSGGLPHAGPLVAVPAFAGLPTGGEFEMSGGYPACNLVVKQGGL